jgi:hypothetical protein
VIPQKPFGCGLLRRLIPLSRFDTATATTVTHLWSPTTQIRHFSLAFPVANTVAYPPNPSLRTTLPSPSPHNRRDRDDEEEYSRIPIPTSDDEDLYDELFYDTDPETDPDPQTFTNNVTTLELTLGTSTTLLDEVATVDMAFRIGPVLDGKILDHNPPPIPIHPNQYTALPEVYDKVSFHPPASSSPTPPKPSDHVKRKRRSPNASNLQLTIPCQGEKISAHCQGTFLQLTIPCQGEKMFSM